MSVALTLTRTTALGDGTSTRSWPPFPYRTLTLRRCRRRRRRRRRRRHRRHRRRCRCRHPPHRSVSCASARRSSLGQTAFAVRKHRLRLRPRPQHRLFIRQNAMARRCARSTVRACLRSRRLWHHHLARPRRHRRPHRRRPCHPPMPRGQAGAAASTKDQATARDMGKVILCQATRRASTRPCASTCALPIRSVIRLSSRPQTAAGASSAGSASTQ